MVQKMQILQLTRIRSLVLASCCIICAAWPAKSDSWIDHEHSTAGSGIESWATGGSYIVEHFGESEFTGKYRETGNSFQAEALAVTLPVDYLTALEVTTQAVAEEFGIESATRRDDLDLSSAWDRWGDDGGKLFMKAKWQEALAAARVGTRGISAAQIKTKAYNRIPDREGYSQAKFLVFDGNKLY